MAKRDTQKPIQKPQGDTIKKGGKNNLGDSTRAWQPVTDRTTTPPPKKGNNKK